MEDKEKKEQPPIAEQVKDYLETYIELVKLRAIERGTSIFAGIVTDLFIVLCMSLAFLFISITLAFYLAQLFHSYWQGFGAVALIYIVAIAIISSNRKKFERPIVNALLRRLFK